MSTADDSYEPTSSGVETQSSEMDDDNLYKFLVLDSGPIVRLTGLSTLKNAAKSYYTVPAVLQEIRDAKARQHLKQLPFELKTREASPQGIKLMAEFARQTGDYNSLSAVDLQVLGLLYDLELEASGGNMEHVRKTPKRTLGVGRIEALNKEASNTKEKQEEASNPQESSKDGTAFFQPTDIAENAQDASAASSMGPPATQAPIPATKPKSWAMLVNPAEASAEPPSIKEEAKHSKISEESLNEPSTKIAQESLNVAFCSMNLSKTSTSTPASGFVSGQFSDAEEDVSTSTNSDKDDESDNDDSYANGDKDVSDEECDVYILDPEETKERTGNHNEEVVDTDFPSLAQAMQVPYEGSDENDDDDTIQEEKTPAILAKEHAETKKAMALKPVTKSGKMYNSFRKYGDIVKPRGIKKKESFEDAYYTSGVETVTPDITTDDDYEPRASRSRIMGGMTMSGQASQVEDDGEGWITCKSDISKLKSTGSLDLKSANNRKNHSSEQKGPPISQRAACATTDFAMQNVILQMNLELLSVDGIKVRRLKSWVTRCGACFTVYADNNDPTVGNLKRLFCSRCGSDMMQRVAASVDSKTGRLRLHLSKKYKNNLRGTKYSLPKPGTNNRFQGDLLLREDQLMMGAWNQKVKKRSGGKARSSAQSMFGSDIASNVGCHADFVKRDDIKVGFGRRNPNAAKGRERRGKKKKSSDKACGLRRY